MNKMIRRFLTLFLCLTLCFSLLAGCAGQTTAPQQEATPTPAAAPIETEPPADEPAEPSVEPGMTQYSPEDTYSIDYPGSAVQFYDADTIYSIDFEGEAVQTVPAQAEAELTGSLDGVLSDSLAASFDPSASDGIIMAQAAAPSDDGLLPQGTLLPQSLEMNANGNGNDGIVMAQTAANSAPKQLTIEDIQAMNPNSVVIDIYRNNGYLSTLVGKYYDQKVSNMEDGVLSIQGMASLLGLGKGCEFFAVYSEVNEKGYTFYTYQQRYGEYTLRYATLRIVVDPEGYTAGLTCSFVPNIGIAKQEAEITKERAEQVVRSRYSSADLTYYPEHTVRLAVTYNFAVYNCYVVYTSNPDATSASETAAFDMPYLEHFVCTDGTYLTAMPANNFATSNADVIDNSGYFEGLETYSYSATVKLQDGTSRDVTVPVSYNNRDGRYYLMDPYRKIAVAQYYDLNYKGKVNLVSSDTIGGWSDNNLIAYANYIIVYDFYADHGIYSIDGFGIPILVTVGWCNADGTPVDNACFYGVNQGWACFGVSDVNHSSDCVDVVGHEFTHGVTNLSMQGSVYQNETGAINEAYSDIMGNLAEMSLGYTSDESWLVGERSGRTCRDMSSPNRFQQPAYVGDLYYWPSVLYPDYDANDLGGVHINNSLLGHIAYRMGQTGMSYQQQISMWLNSIEMLTPTSSYEDLHGILLLSLKINGLLESCGGVLNASFADAGLNDDWSKTYLTAVRDGCGRVVVETSDEIAQSPARIFFQSTGGSKETFRGFPNADGTVSLLLPAGSYIAQLSIGTGDNRANYNYSASGWVKDGSFGTFSVTAGKTTELTGTSGKKPGSTQGQKLNLVKLDAGYFSMLVPDGWRIELNGEYAGMCIKIFDPEDPSTQMFFYGSLAPYHKSESTRAFWRRFDAMIGNGPVLAAENILGILNCWDYAIQYQSYYEGKQLFTSLYDMELVDGSYFSGPYASVGGIESGALIRCATDYDDDCKLTVAAALVDHDIYQTYGGNMFYTCYALTGVLAPSDRYDAVYEDLLECLHSLTFSTAYIRASQSSAWPMADQSTISRNLDVWCGVMKLIYETFGP